jgi:hypothetical protein
VTMSEIEPTHFPPGELLVDIRALIAEARCQTTVAVNMGFDAPLLAQSASASTVRSELVQYAVRRRII